ncbi:methyltransferase domain-containing protein [Streptomyces sp. BV286]|uniref:class I SAM-dependent methyltransferase n=1 Tax=unclassified Streptomyces TaxID=2593676 RepID=UPI001C2EF801|nr:methyltransferase domain-containing protein [Streptomyces sp. BV286]MBV1941869.1 methyltransferase domain-containing protein [Streptomyces sp. BV286]
MGSHKERESLMAKYKFGDSTTAETRLVTVARVFEPSSRAFLQSYAAPGASLAVDLGCGPGHSTRLLHEVLQPTHTLGLDRSASFLATASASASPGMLFRRHDVTVTPLPVRQPDILFARLLLSHLKEPARLVSEWVAELAPGGSLLLDEVESIETSDETGREYQKVVQSMLRNNGQRLDVGRLLTAASPAGAGRVRQRLVTVQPTSQQVGLMFALNLRVWRSDPFLVARYSPDWLDALQCELDRAAEGLRSLAVTWTMRQLALTR